MAEPLLYIPAAFLLLDVGVIFFLIEQHKIVQAKRHKPRFICHRQRAPDFPNELRSSVS